MVVRISCHFQSLHVILASFTSPDHWHVQLGRISFLTTSPCQIFSAERGSQTIPWSGCPPKKFELAMSEPAVVGEVVDLTTQLPEGGHSILECEAVYAKAHQGMVRFDSSVLSFEASGDISVHFPITAVKGMQVSKTGSSKILLKILTDSAEGSEALFDFTNTTNGLAWREAFKESLTSRIRSISDSSTSGAPATPASAAATHKSAADLTSRTPKIAGATKDLGNSPSTTLKLSAADIKSFLEAHPALLDLYAEQVVSMLIISQRRCHTARR